MILDGFAGHKLIERKETPLAKMMTKCRHYSCTFIIAVRTAKYVIKNICRQAKDVVVWADLPEEDLFDLLKEIQYSYLKEILWEQYKALTSQKDYLILNTKAQSFEFVLLSPQQMSFLKAISGIGNFFSRFASGSGKFAKFAGGVQKAANFVTKWAPKVITGVKTGIQFFRSVVGFLDKTGLLNKIDKKGKFREFTDKTGLYKKPDAGSATPHAAGTNGDGMTKTLG